MNDRSLEKFRDRPGVIVASHLNLILTCSVIGTRIIHTVVNVNTASVTFKTSIRAVAAKAVRGEREEGAKLLE